MTEIVINKCWGGFGLSSKAVLELKKSGCPHITERDEEEYFKCDRGSWKEIFKNISWEKYKEQSRGFLDIAKAENGKLLMDGHSDDNRTCRMLVRVVKKLKSDADGEHASLKVVNIPNGVKWGIHEYDGMETVEEKHRSWA